MRICIVGKFPPLQGGTAVQTFWLSYRLAQQGCDVTVLTASAAGAVGERAFHREDEWDRVGRRFPAVSRIRRVEIAREGPEAAAIPSTDAYVTRLAAAALDVIDSQGSDVVIGSYLEPYGVAAHVAAAARELPFAIIHAGSDLGRLAQLPSRRALYRQVLLAADVIVGTRSSASGLAALRGGDEGLNQTRPILTPHDLFTSPAEALEVGELAEALRGTPHAELMSGPSLLRRPVVGVYGKVGPEKGTDALLAAVGAVKRGGVPISVLMMTGGRPEARRWLQDQIGTHALAETVTVIPFLPHWRVPEFLAACDSMCFLEHDFPITAHRPQVPREIAAAGGCLLVSAQALAAEPITVIDNEHALVVDATNPAQLAQALKRAAGEPELRARLGARVGAAFGWSSEARASRWTEDLISLLDERINHRRGLKLSLAAYQRTLLRIYADPAYRRELMDAPAGVSSEGDLTRAEASSLTSLLADRGGLQRYCRTLLDGRLRRLSAPFADVLDAHPEIRPALRDTFHERWVLRDTDAVTDLRRFESLLLGVGEGAVNPDRRAPFAEWVRYAALCSRVVAADNHPRADGQSGPDGPPGLQGASTDVSGLLVARSPGTELATFRGRLVDSSWEASEAPWRVGAVRDRDHLEARVYELADPVFTGLSELQGPIPFGAFAGRLAGADAGPAVREAADAAARRLLDLGLLCRAG